MKTTFDLPDPLLRRAKAAAAAQGRPLRDLVAEAIEARLSAPPSPPQRRSEPPPDEWQEFLDALVLQPDGSYINPNGIDDDDPFFQALDDLRSSRMREQIAPFEPAAEPAAPTPRRRRTRTKA
ncbi:MAG: hypothetical protein ACREXI_11780 [Caldimonas sp.]